MVWASDIVCIIFSRVSLGRPWTLLTWTDSSNAQRQQTTFQATSSSAEHSILCIHNEICQSKWASDGAKRWRVFVPFTRRHRKAGPVCLMAREIDREYTGIQQAGHSRPVSMSTLRHRDSSRGNNMSTITLLQFTSSSGNSANRQFSEAFFLGRDEKSCG